MKRIGKIINFELSLCSKTTYFIVPFILLFIVLYNLYYQRPIQVISSFCITGLVAFLLLCWLGYSYIVHQDEVTSQIVMLRVNHDLIYYISEILILLLISLVVSLISVGFPLVQNAVNGFQLFDRPVTGKDAVSALLLITASGFLGSCVGCLCGTGLSKDRKLSLCLVILVAVLSIGKSGMIHMIPASKYIMWIVPPISDISVIYSSQDQYTWTSVLYGIAVLDIYGALAYFISTLIRRKKGLIK